MQKRKKLEQGSNIRATVAVFLIGLLVSPSVALASPAQNQPAPAEVRRLELNKPIEREMKGGESHFYEITLEANQYLNVVVEQKGIDVVVQVIAPDGKTIMEVDSPNGAQGPEPVSLITETSGRYQLKVSSLDNKASQGRYEIRLLALRVPTASDRAAVEKERLTQEAKQLLAQAPSVVDDETGALGAPVSVRTVYVVMYHLPFGPP